jgi:hypothetical protein
MNLLSIALKSIIALLQVILLNGMQTVSPLLAPHIWVPFQRTIQPRSLEDNLLLKE